MTVEKLLEQWNGYGRVEVYNKDKNLICAVDESDDILSYKTTIKVFGEEEVSHIIDNEGENYFYGIKVYLKN